MSFGVECLDEIIQFWESGHIADATVRQLTLKALRNYRKYLTGGKKSGREIEVKDSRK